MKSAAESSPLKKSVESYYHVSDNVSDYYLVHFQLHIKLQNSCQPHWEIKEYRKLHEVDINKFRLDLEASVLCNTKFTSLDDAVNLIMIH